MDEQRTNIKLKSVTKQDIETVWRMQVEAFSELLEKYQDYDMSPAAESMDKILARFEQPWTTYYFIMANDEKVGAIRVVDKKDGSRKRISPIWIMKEYRNKGYAQQAIVEAEKIYGPDHWCLDTILQEKGNLHLYEKLGYHRTGRIDKINDRMDIVFYEKDGDEMITYQRLTENELDTFIRMRIRQLREEGAKEDIDLVPALKDYYDRHMADGTFVSWLAVDGDRIVGTSGMSFVEKPPYFGCPSGKMGLLSSMFTDPDYRRKGIAKELLSRVIDEARDYGCGTVQITASDMGVLLYTDFGFVKNGNFMQYKL
jgi:GNAT superfamily N-acetyltransferase